MTHPPQDQPATACCLPAEIEAELEPLGGLEGLVAGLPPPAELADLTRSLSLLAEPLRLTVLLVLRQGQQCVCVLKELTGVADSRLSYHLNILKREGLVLSRRDRSFNRYSLTSKGEELLAALNHFEQARVPRVGPARILTGMRE